jgi:hypothetical protein
MPDALMWYAGRMWLHWTFEGQAAAASAVAAQAYAEYPLMAGWITARALTLRLAGHDDELTEVTAGLPDILSTAMFDMFWLVSHFYTATALRSGARDRALAQMIYERLLPYRTLHATYGIGYLGPVETALGACARTLGDVHAADAHHDAAAAAIERCGAVRARALNGYLWALALLDHDTPEARGRALELLNETRKASEAHGYVTLQQQADHLLAETTREA